MAVVPTSCAFLLQPIIPLEPHPEQLESWSALHRRVSSLSNPSTYSACAGCCWNNEVSCSTLQLLSTLQRFLGQVLINRRRADFHVFFVEFLQYCSSHWPRLFVNKRESLKKGSSAQGLGANMCFAQLVSRYPQSKTRPC